MIFLCVQYLHGLVVAGCTVVGALVVIGALVNVTGALEDALSRIKRSIMLNINSITSKIVN